MITNEEKIQIAARVKNGALFLDTKKPGWFRLIDNDVLDMKSDCYCVLGQLYNGFWQAILPHSYNIFGAPQSSVCQNTNAHKLATYYGFTDENGCCFNSYYYKECWIEEISTRRAALEEREKYRDDIW